MNILSMGLVGAVPLHGAAVIRGHVTLHIEAPNLIMKILMEALS